ncbi:MAG TPA: hypothetical protein VD905_17250 [Flavobacteriales bacterium]|nr:hypothetical protein [Flavobacteriales bacterium]
MHNWGDDFAQYLMHSQKLASFQNPAETNYIYNPDYAVESPPVYPLGFPLLLTPISIFSPESLLPYKLFMQLVYCGFVLSVFLVLRKHLGTIFAFVISLLIAYNPFLLEFKSQILSDIPFAVFFMLSCYYIQKGTGPVKTGLLVAFTVFIRTAGIALLMAWLVKLAIDYYKKNGLRLPVFDARLFLNCFFIFLFPLGILFLNQYTGGSGYASQFAGVSTIETVKSNLVLQLNILNNVIIADLPAYGHYKYTCIVLPLLLFTGLFSHLRQRGYFLVLVFACYECVVLIFPYQYGTFRFIIPILPVIYLFLAEGLLCIALLFKKRIITVAGYALLLFTVFTMYVKTNEVLSQNQKISPEDKPAQEMFAFSRDSTSKNAHFLFVKPKALGYFAQRKCVTNNPAGSDEEITSLLAKYQVDYIVQGLENAALDHYIERSREGLEKVFVNRQFTVYKIKGRF